MMLTDYNTFRHKNGPALRCAVQPGRPLPHFLGTGRWEWSGVLLRGARPPKGFKIEVAAYVSDLSGYYFYHTPPSGEWTARPHRHPQPTMRQALASHP